MPLERSNLSKVEHLECFRKDVTDHDPEHQDVRRDSKLHMGQEACCIRKFSLQPSPGQCEPRGTTLPLELISDSPHTFSGYICVFKVVLFFANLLHSRRRLLMLPLETAEELFLWGWVYPFPKCCRQELQFSEDLRGSSSARVSRKVGGRRNGINHKWIKWFVKGP